MGRVNAGERKDVFALLQWLGAGYKHGDSFTADQAHRHAGIQSAAPFYEWDIESFTRHLDELAEHHHLKSFISSGEEKKYQIPVVKDKRRGAEDSLPLTIEAIKKATKSKPASIKDLEATGHSQQMIRTAIHILFALGIVRRRTVRSTLEIEWDFEQEEIVRKTFDSTSEYFQLRQEIRSLDQQIREKKEELKHVQEQIQLEFP
jgi:hypothetical protein